MEKYEISKITTSLHSFTVFNVEPPSYEGATPIVYWTTSPLNLSNNFILNQVGLYITFINFSQRFNSAADCDYISTNKMETSLMELSGNVWLGVTISSTTSSNRYLLHSILNYCRIMFSHFFFPLPPNNSKSNIDYSNEASASTAPEALVPTPNIEAVIEQINIGFPLIVESIDWSRLSFQYLFNSCMNQSITGDIGEFKKICDKFVLDNPNFCDKIAVFHKKKAVYSQFPPTVTRALSYGLRKRFKHLVLPNVQPSSSKLTWRIGLYTNKNGLTSVFQQLIFYNNESHLIVAFDYRQFKIVMTMPEKVEIDAALLRLIPQRLTPIRLFLRKIDTNNSSSSISIDNENDSYINSNYTIKQNNSNINDNNNNNNKEEDKYKSNSIQCIDRNNIGHNSMLDNVPLMFAIAQNQSQRQRMHYEGNMNDTISRVVINNNFIKAHNIMLVYDKSATIVFPQPHHFIVYGRNTFAPEHIEDAVIVKLEDAHTALSLVLKVAQKLMSQKDKNQNKKKQCLIS